MAVAPPSLSGYLQFLRAIVGIGTEDLPNNSPYIEMAYDYALSIVNQYLSIVDTPGVVNGSTPTPPPIPFPQTGPFPTYYAYAVYNLAAHFQVCFTPDSETTTFFSTLRKSMNIPALIPGLIESSYDQNTGQSFVVPDFVKKMTMADLQNLGTPWGRFYMGLAQAYGPTIWGITP